MQTVWRMVTTRFVETAFSGEGARRYGGRWNRKGVAVVYTASSQSLAMLEMLVQDEPLRAKYSVIPATLPDDLDVQNVIITNLPQGWRDPQACEALQDIGMDWIARRESAVLAVPSAVVPTEWNFLLNPAHPDFPNIAIGSAEQITTDGRLFRRSASSENAK
ncbi:MAG: RES family NAD+ phosphorylase [Gammaproteobacteria bacterium]|jgi:RES domain-containing protein|uniref:RES family NAD+ phosphorylase n=1 Tax=Acidithiobacillus ferrooxidans TaxID=920 RepID=UPI0021474F73|nr:RES family NAD+ phosphorylase [Acidithiobacillus ferrooxidans]MCL4526581.1 RES family NAD+ phosphorylase [Gammaproteobacteria bacterium]MCR1345194.1 RES family NAD+ phosphorylase [Acidithiobacillus ferrooxidans]MCR1355594.1 RES family NAD+ phosphorylase [Acidithiobacillus ferrooxidans]MDA8377372.1 RES family NAD+ phosphorylase [Planctomycetia bacterium]